jgi:hypothetical protein
MVKIACDGGHRVRRDRPDLFLDATAQMISMVRAAGGD